MVTQIFVVILRVCICHHACIFFRYQIASVSGAAGQIVKIDADHFLTPVFVLAPAHYVKGLFVVLTVCTAADIVNLLEHFPFNVYDLLDLFVHLCTS